MNDLYLIGNGFDLAHGLKTSYNDFLLWYLKHTINKISPNNHFEDELVVVDRRFGTPIRDHVSLAELFEECEQFQISIKYKHPFFKQIVSTYREYRWVDIEYEYYSKLIGIYQDMKISDKNKNGEFGYELLRLNKCFKSIKEKLVIYLKTIDKSRSRENADFKEILFEETSHKNESNSERLFLYFNYTSTLKLYTTQYFSYEYNSIGIHGKLEEPIDEVIFGYGDEMDLHYAEIENLNNNEFLKNIKSFSYFKTDNYQKVIRFIESGDFTVKILGHSCGLSDRILLNTIFEHHNCKHIKIYYYQKSETENDYFEKTQEISRHFKASMKGEMRKKIVSFEKSSPMPQNPKYN